VGLRSSPAVARRTGTMGAWSSHAAALHDEGASHGVVPPGLAGAGRGGRGGCGKGDEAEKKNKKARRGGAARGAAPCRLSTSAAGPSSAHPQARRGARGQRSGRAELSGGGREEREEEEGQG
jgi:hypothetical protein